MTELKRCPFCGGEVAIAELGDYLISWMSITRGNGKNGCKCRVIEFRMNNSGEIEIIHDGRKDTIEAWNKRYKED